MTNYKDFINKETYEIFAGADWPRYEDFISGNYCVADTINQEINEFIIRQNEINFQSWQNLQRLDHIRFWIYQVLPAICGLIGFVVLGGTFQKFLVVSIICVCLNQFYNHTVHKWLTHRQFVPKWYIRPLMLWSITLIGNYNLKSWVIIHRLHHRYSDTPKDPQLASIGVYKMMVPLLPYTALDYTKFKFVESIHLPWKDVQVVSKYQNYIYCVNFILLCMIDLQVALLSLFTLRLYAVFYPAISNYVIHGRGQGIPTNLPWYWELWFFGESLHKDHHEHPSRLDLSKPGRIDVSAKIWKHLANNIRH